MSTPSKTVGIIGSGPSGAALGSFLTMKGYDVTMFDDGKRPELVVGESLIPAIIPVMRRLGIEERAAAICQFKPGVSFTGLGDDIHFCFESVASCSLPTYAYNAPRRAFDQLLNQRADELGVKRARVRARVERVGVDGLRLAAETLAEAPWLGGRQLDLLVDSTGRSRLFARALEIPAQIGPRRDAAHFAHYEGFIEYPPHGQVVIGRLEAGWCWRIPLPGRLSVGVVMHKDICAQLGATPGERLEAAIERDPVLAVAGKDRRRITDVATYTNYQLVSERGHGAGWAMTGDAFGFVDPMLSPGMWLALHSAEILAENLGNLPAYEREMRRLLKAWMALVELFYDGRMFAMYHTGIGLERKHPGRISQFVHSFFDKQIACMAAGATTTSRLRHGALKLMMQPGVLHADPNALAIR